MCLLFGYDLILWLFVCDLVFIYWFRLRWFFYCYMSLGGGVRLLVGGLAVSLLVSRLWVVVDFLLFCLCLLVVLFGFLCLGYML